MVYNILKMKGVKEEPDFICFLAGFRGAVVQRAQLGP